MQQSKVQVDIIYHTGIDWAKKHQAWPLVAIFAIILDALGYYYPHIGISGGALLADLGTNLIYEGAYGTDSRIQRGVYKDSLS